MLICDPTFTSHIKKHILNKFPFKFLRTAVQWIGGQRVYILLRHTHHESQENIISPRTLQETTNTGNGVTQTLTLKLRKQTSWDFPGGTVVEDPPANAGDAGSSPGLGRSHMPWSN